LKSNGFLLRGVSERTKSLYNPLVERDSVSLSAARGCVAPVGTDGFTCPSGLCSSGNLLIGIVQNNGVIASIRPALQVDDDFVRKAHDASNSPPETRFRFAGPCVSTSCEQWAQGRCTVGDAVAQELPGGDSHLRACVIRSTCRWWAQNGPAACHSCSGIVHTPHPGQPDETAGGSPV
jgi:hypothetical protein